MPQIFFFFLKQISWSGLNRYPQEINGHNEGSASTSGSMKQSGTARNVMPDRESKSSNINKMVSFRG